MADREGVMQALAREAYEEDGEPLGASWAHLDEPDKVPWLHRVGIGPLGFPKARGTYRRRTRQKPIRVIWREDGRDRSKAFGGINRYVKDEVRWARRKSELPVLVINVETGRVWDTAFGGSVSRDPRAATPEERERILAMKLTYECR